MLNDVTFIPDYKLRKGIVGPRLHAKLDCMYGILYTRKSFIYKYETSTLTPFVKPCNKLNLAL